MKQLIYWGILLCATLLFPTSSSGQTGKDGKPKVPTTPVVVRGFMMPEKNDQKNFDDAKAWGASVVRLQIFPARYASGKGQDVWTGLPAYLDQLETQVKAAKQAGLKVVIDLHESPFQNVVAQNPEFWKRTDLEENFCRIWSEII